MCARLFDVRRIFISIAVLLAGFSGPSTIGIAGQNLSIPPPPPSDFRIVNSPLAGPGSIAAVAGTPQSTLINTAFAASLQVVVRDSNGNGVAGLPVAFRAPTSGAAALFNGNSAITAVTNGNGVAVSPVPTANGTAGSYVVTASVANLNSSAAFSLSNTTLTAAFTGGTWTNVTPGNVNLTSNLDCGNFGTITVAADPARPSNLYTQFNCQGIWKSTDFGQTWSGPINTGSGGQGVNGAGGITIAPGPAGQPPILYSAGIRGTGNGFWRSTDGGVSWTNYNVAPGGSRQDFYPPVVDPYNPNHLVMNGHEMNLIVQSTNGGQTWTSVPMDPGMNENGGTGELTFINTGNAATTAQTWLWLAQGSAGAIGSWRTTNGGASWTRVDNNEHPHGLSQFYQPDTSGVMYMAGVYSALGWGVLRSTDYGQTWTHVGNAMNEAVVFGTPNRLYAMWSWACGFCNVDTSAQTAPVPGTSGWTPMAMPPAMAMGPAQATVVYDGSHYVVVTANWLSGVWRFVEQ